MQLPQSWPGSYDAARPSTCGGSFGTSSRFALDPDPLVAAFESVYEARAALGEDAVRELIAAA